MVRVLMETPPTERLTLNAPLILKAEALETLALKVSEVP
jgi:hypothetical protein